ncbi:hypothetical protein AGMMS49942_21000 [Spirochaetia bacterium]|nr:hypothetical protein AGMMS49942_21000 [Spirochaetia bacterium]
MLKRTSLPETLLITVLVLSVFVTCVSAPVPGPDTDPDEPDSMGAPVRVKNDDWIDRYLSANDADWFSFTPESAGLLIAETDGETDTVLELYRYNTLLRANDDVENNPNARIEYFVDPGVMYIIKCEGIRLAGATENDRGPYRFRLQMEPMPNDTAEPNDTLKQATPVGIGDTVTGYFLTPEDVDFYTLTAPGAGRLLVYTSGTLDTLLEVYDSRGEVIARDDDSGYQGNAKLVTGIPGADSVYIRVNSYQGATGRYYIHTRFMAPVKPDPFENDDSLANAKDIQPDSSQERNFTAAADVDWVRLQIKTGGTYELKTVAADNYLDTLIELFDTKEELIAQDDDSGGYWNAFLSLSLEPGTYYLRITTVDKDPLEDNRYTLSVSPNTGP